MPASGRGGWGLLGAPLPAIRRGLVVAMPVGACLLLELGLEDGVAAGLGTAAMICGFIAFDAPARVRVRWQLTAAPFVGAAAAIGVLSSVATAPAVIAMAVVAGVSGYLVSVSMRLAVVGLSCTLALLIAQGQLLDVGEAATVLLLGALGGVAQAAMAALAWVAGDREREPGTALERMRAGMQTLGASPTLRDRSFHHALRFGGALAIGVAIYRLAGLDEHGYWVPLTILFVLKPDPDQTSERIAMRAAGTVIGLVLATAFAELLGDDLIPTVAVLTLAAALAYALLAIEYALFTVAITVFVVLLTDSLGSSPWDAADERALGTAIGITVAALAFRLFGEVAELTATDEFRRRERSQSRRE